jgi:hypothetical protein
MQKTSVTDNATQAMIEAMLEQLVGEDMQGLSLDGLRDAMRAPGAAETVAALMPLEATSVKPGEPAPDFTLPYLPGQDQTGGSMTLSNHFGKRPVALIFGSYT